MEEVFEHLKCTREGLSHDAVQERLDIFRSHFPPCLQASSATTVGAAQAFELDHC